MVALAIVGWERERIELTAREERLIRHLRREGAQHRNCKVRVVYQDGTLHGAYVENGELDLEGQE